MKITVDDSNVRLDQYLTKVTEKSRSKIQKLIREGEVRVNGKTQPCSYTVNIGDDIIIEEEKKSLAAISATDIEIEVVYEDSYLLVVNKPSGLVVHPAAGHAEDTLVNALMMRFQLSKLDETRPGIVHRIDKDTSGLLLIAKDDQTHEKLANMIKEKEVERIYLALVEGVIAHDTGEIDAPIGRDPKYRQRMCVTDQNSKEAVTYFRVVQRYKKYTLVECRLKTGRTHQIRVHFQYIGYPLLGDSVYGKRNKKSNFGQFLHAHKLHFIHPITKEELQFSSPLPEEFQQKLDELEKS